MSIRSGPRTRAATANRISVIVPRGTPPSNRNDAQRAAEALAVLSDPVALRALQDRLNANYAPKNRTWDRKLLKKAVNY